MVSFEIFVKAMPPRLSESKVLPSFCFAFKIPDDRAASSIQSLKRDGSPSQINISNQHQHLEKNKTETMIKETSSIQKPKWKNLAFKGNIDLSNTHLMLIKYIVSKLVVHLNKLQTQ